MAPGRVILIHGASSAGKTTLTEAVRARSDVPFMAFNFDTLRDGGALPLDHPAFDWADRRGAVFEGLDRSVLAFAEAGNDLIVEIILDLPGRHAGLRRLWAKLDLFFVALRCPLDVLSARAAGRKDRPEMAEADFSLMERPAGYDLELDGCAPAAENADRLLAAWAARGSRSGFFDGPAL